MQDAMITEEQFEEKYADFMLDGLTSTSTYIPLKSNKRVGINIAIRPYATRSSDSVVIFGGKFRVGYTLENGDYVKTKIVDLHEEDRVQRLKEFCKGFSWYRVSAKRLSAVVGFGVAAGPYDPEVLDKVIESELAMQLVNQLEAKFSKYNDGQVFSSKRKATAALAEAWYLQAIRLFKAMPETTKLPETVLGKTSKLLNSGQKSYTDNVISFTKKVSEMKNAD